MLIEYYLRFSILRVLEMQEQTHLVEKQNCKTIKKLLGVMLRKDKDRLIRYNYPKLVVT